MRTSATTPIRLLIVHDGGLARDGLCAILEKVRGISVVAVAPAVSDVINIYKDRKPDIVLLDIDEKSERDGFELLNGISQKAPEVPILVLSSVSDQTPTIYSRAANSGASGVVLEQHGTDALIKAIKKVRAGEVWFDRTTVANIFKQRNRQSDESNAEVLKQSSLTAREREVVGLVCRGLRNKQVAAELFICETTVTHHLSSIFSKLGVSDRLELVLYALSNGLVKPE